VDTCTFLWRCSARQQAGHKCAPIWCSCVQRDVPGMSRAALSTLRDWGVHAISVGVNEFSAPPAVPFNKPFIWRDPPSGAALIAFWHPFGYGGHTTDAHGAVTQLTPPQDCVHSPADPETGGRDILCFSWRGDNSGPFEDPSQVMAIFAKAREGFPGATVRASTFDAFVRELKKHKKSLEVVEQEIGDTWIHGVASDPVKMQQYRAIMRMRTQCLVSESCTIEVR
jgi:hypothetical protein